MESLFLLAFGEEEFLAVLAMTVRSLFQQAAKREFSILPPESGAFGPGGIVMERRATANEIPGSGPPMNDETEITTLPPIRFPDMFTRADRAWSWRIWSWTSLSS